MEICTYASVVAFPRFSRRARAGHIPIETKSIVISISLLILKTHDMSEPLQLRRNCKFCKLVRLCVS